MARALYLPPAKLWKAAQEYETQHGPLELIFNVDSFKERFALKPSDRMVVGLSRPAEFFSNARYFRINAPSLEEATIAQVEPLSQMRFANQSERHYTCQPPEPTLRNLGGIALDYLLKREFWSYLQTPVRVVDISAWEATEF